MGQGASEANKRRCLSRGCGIETLWAEEYTFHSRMCFNTSLSFCHTCGGSSRRTSASRTTARLISLTLKVMRSLNMPALRHSDQRPTWCSTQALHIRMETQNGPDLFLLHLSRFRLVLSSIVKHPPASVLPQPEESSSDRCSLQTKFQVCLALAPFLKALACPSIRLAAALWFSSSLSSSWPSR